MVPLNEVPTGPAPPTMLFPAPIFFSTVRIPVTMSVPFLKSVRDVPLYADEKRYVTLADTDPAGATPM